VFTIEGDLEIGAARTPLPTRHLGVLGDGDAVMLQAGAAPARCLLIAARRLAEPVARYGPFVMNTQAEIVQAFDDYRANRF